MSTPLAFTIRESAVAGQGFFAIRPIKKGERIIEYTGERISHPVADARYDDESMQEHHTFLFAVTSRTVIDASHGGNEARFINHSCDFNCETEIEKGRVFIFALRDISVGEELHYVYAYERSGDETAEDERRYKCLCGAPTCRGSIMEPKATYLKRTRAEAAKRAAKKRTRSSAKKKQAAPAVTPSGAREPLLGVGEVGAGQLMPAGHPFEGHVGASRP